MNRLPPCPCCGNENTVATTVFEPANTPKNKFIVHCSPQYGGCGLRTNEHTSWSNAIDAWINLCNSMPLPAPPKDPDSLVLTVTYECDCGERWPVAVKICGKNHLSFNDIVAELSDAAICSVCGFENAHIVRSVLTSSDDEYSLRIR